MPDNNIKSVIESLLFASEGPLALDKIKKVLDMDASEILLVLRQLQSEYEVNDRGVRIVEVAGGFQMVTNTSFAPFLKKLYKERKVERLSRPALETLAIIAYKQPVTRLEIESLRSVNIDGVIKSLMDREMIRIVGRKKAPGRPAVFGTTKQFLEHFGLNSLDDLPKLDETGNILANTLQQKEEVKEELVEVPIQEGQNEPSEPAQTN